MITSSVKETPTHRNGQQNVELHISGRQTLIHGMFGLAARSFALRENFKSNNKSIHVQENVISQDLFGNRIGMLLLTM